MNQQKTVLIIDDSSDIRNLVCELLQMEGYRALSAENGEEGLRVLEKEIPNLILLDVRMPVMDGWEFREAQKADSRFKNIPTFIFCAGSKEDAQPPGLDATGFLSKPVDIDELLAAIAPHLH